MTRVFCCCAIVLTGCATDKRLADEKPPDWEFAPRRTTVVAPLQTNAAPLLPASMPEPTNDTWVALGEWAAKRGLPSPQLLTTSPTTQYTLSASNGLFVLQIGSLQARWAGLQVWLGFAPQLIGEQVFLHALDLQKTIEPLMIAQVVPPAGQRTIVIDPGHGGSNTGTRSVLDGRLEKEFALDWAMRLAELLKQRGWRAFLTRTNDADLSLADRVAFAEAQKADLFLSLHFNAVESNRQQAGIETYTLTPTGMPSSLVREFEDDSTLVFPNNAFDGESLRYAVRLHRALVESTGSADRGVRRARFMGVLRGQNRPAVLLEGGYLSNPDEARQIENPEYRQRLADAIAKVLE